jgi:hypothetical protein
MENFLLLDLTTQVSEVNRYTKGWTKEALISWLFQYGSVKKIVHPNDNNLYVFFSSAGVITGFRITEANQLVIITNHSTFKP